jgi:hypothetical protein
MSTTFHQTLSSIRGSRDIRGPKDHIAISIEITTKIIMQIMGVSAKLWIIKIKIRIQPD